jgi:hypothetical protein
MLKLVHFVFDLLQVSESRKRGFMNSRTGVEVYMLI